MKIKTRDREEKGQKVKASPDTKDDPTDKQPPKFSFQHLQKKYCFSKCQNDEQLSFAKKMFTLSQCSWAELRTSGRHGLGYEIIQRTAIKTAIPTHVTADVKLIAFRFFGNAPMVGYKDKDGTFYILWFDRDFTLYNHE